MAKLITINASGYSPRNKDMATMKASADAKYNESIKLTSSHNEKKKSLAKEAGQIYSQLRDAWTSTLEGQFYQIHRSKQHHHLYGLFASELEPSSQYTIEFDDHDDWKVYEKFVKTEMVLFAQNFRQQNIHLVDLYIDKPCRLGYGELVGDISFQKKAWIELNIPKMASVRTLDSFGVLQEIAKKAGISNLSTDYFGRHVILFYSMGRNGWRTFDSEVKSITAILKKQGLFKKKVLGDVALTNYGDSEWGGSHSYIEALKFLNGKG